MKILVANLGSTSFKYRLLDMTDESQLARGGIERIGAPKSQCFVEISGSDRRESEEEVKDHAVALERCLDQLTDPEFGCLKDTSEVSAVGFKAVHGGRVSGVQRVTSEVLSAMEEVSQIAPAHNPPYINAMRIMSEKMPSIPLVAAFDTDFHQTVPDRQSYYAVPWEWAENHLARRWGFHGASHHYIATRMAELSNRDDLRIISCHLGGSSSLCAIRAGKSVAVSMGTSPQTGLPQNNRVGDFDPFALPLIMEGTGKTLDEVLSILANSSGLAGLSDISGDLRDLEQEAEKGSERARLAIDVYTTSIRQYLGAFLVELGGADVVVFTGGIGENSQSVRQAVCRDLVQLGIVLDAEANKSAQGESKINADNSQTEIWVVPTNEELIVARQVKQFLQG